MIYVLLVDEKIYGKQNDRSMLLEFYEVYDNFTIYLSEIDANTEIFS